MRNWLPASLVAVAMVLGGCQSNKEVPKAPGLAAMPLKSPSLITPKRVQVAPEYRDDAPDRYLVQPGDTLWDIAGRFLKSPARWKDIWHANPQLKNPNRLYPGDVISYKRVNGQKKLQIAGTTNQAHGQNSGKKTADGRPIYNLMPTVRTQLIESPIPTLPKAVVYPFVTKNLIVEPGYKEDYPYIISAGTARGISLTQRGQVYALGDAFEADEYDVFRESSPIIAPQTGELLGIEIVYVGRLKLSGLPNDDGVATFVQMNNARPLYPDDVLIPAHYAQAGMDLHFFPRVPSVSDTVSVIRAMGQSQQAASQFSTLLLDAGANDGMAEGDVFTLVRGGEQQAVSREGLAVRLPDREVGLAIVYQVHGQTSYALVMNATDLIYPGDRLVAP